MSLSSWPITNIYTLCDPEPYLFLKSKNKHLLSFDVVVHTLAKQAKDPWFVPGRRRSPTSLWVILC